MLDEISDKEKYTLAGIGIVLLVVGFVVGFAAAGTGGSGKMASNGGVSENQVRQTANQYVGQRLQQQKRQMKALANRSGNLSAGDISLDGSVDSVKSSGFGSLYNVTVSITGRVPSPRGGGLRNVDRKTNLFISKDGRYIFQRPIDTQRRAQPQIPSSNINRSSPP